MRLAASLVSFLLLACATPPEEGGGLHTMRETPSAPSAPSDEQLEEFFPRDGADELRSQVRPVPWLPEGPDAEPVALGFATGVRPAVGTSAQAVMHAFGPPISFSWTGELGTWH